MNSQKACRSQAAQRWNRTHIGKSIGAIGLLGLLQGGACAVPDRGDPPEPVDTHVTAADTAGTGEGTTGGDGETAPAKVSYAASVHSILVAKCSAAGCHAPPGQNGFAITGSDVTADYNSTLARVTVGDPAGSKLLKKATGETSHGGFAVLDTGSDEYKVVAQWILDGALE